MSPEVQWWIGCVMLAIPFGAIAIILLSIFVFLFCVDRHIRNGVLVATAACLVAAWVWGGFYLMKSAEESAAETEMQKHLVQRPRLR